MCQSELTEFLAELTEFAAGLGGFSPPKQSSRGTPPVSCKGSCTTKAIKRRKISCTVGSDCCVFDLSLHGRWISQSLQDSAKVCISRLLARNGCSLVVVVSATLASQ